jgi:hypothetical protein
LLSPLLPATNQPIEIPSSGYNKDSKYGGITITSQHDVRNLDGSCK